MLQPMSLTEQIARNGSLQAAAMGHFNGQELSFYSPSEGESYQEPTLVPSLPPADYFRR